MKILYAIQGTGNGHLSRSRDIIPVLMKNHEVDLLVSGHQDIPDFPYTFKYQFKGLSFIFGKNGGINFLESYKRNNIKILLSEIKKLPVQEYDLVINDFEPISAWASFLKNVNCISISHQAAVLNKKSPKSKKIDLIGRLILKYYAPSKYKYGFHFKSYDDNIFTPIIRKQVREHKIENKGHYTIYLPAYSNEKILNVLKTFNNIKWEVFSRHHEQKINTNNINFYPFNNDLFIESISTSSGIICGAGFETPSEAIYLKKKLMVIPMKGQYEQQCNASALKELGIHVMKSFNRKNINKIDEWIKDNHIVEINYIDETEDIIEKIINKHTIR